MTEGVVELSHEGRIVMANGAAISLFDLPEAKVLGSPLVQLLPALDAGAPFWETGCAGFCR